MMLDTIKDKVLDKKGKKIKFKFIGTRNQVDEFSGVICGIYDSIFVIRDDLGIMRSFTYSDVLIGNLIINVK